jgi:hypothetical protein
MTYGKSSNISLRLQNSSHAIKLVMLHRLSIYSSNIFGKTLDFLVVSYIKETLASSTLFDTLFGHCRVVIYSSPPHSTCILMEKTRFSIKFSFILFIVFFRKINSGIHIFILSNTTTTKPHTLPPVSHHLVCSLVFSPLFPQRCL